MIIRYYGHSLFTFTMENGCVILTDPYGEFYSYPTRTLKADIVTVSHHHHDHDAVSMVEGNPVIIDQPGVHLPSDGVRIIGIPSKHDDANGAKRGDNLIFCLEAEGLRVVHLGDLGHVLTPEHCHAIGTPDILLTPVGGTYTTDAIAAQQNTQLLNPRVTIPMHYQTDYNRDMPIATVEPFLALMNETPLPMTLCRITHQDINERPSLLLMSITAAAPA